MSLKPTILFAVFLLAVSATASFAPDFAAETSANGPEQRTLGGCDKKGTDTSKDASFSGLARAVSEPVPLVLQPFGEAYRPQFHFTYQKGWMSDINGLVYYQGEYQHERTQKWIIAITLSCGGWLDGDYRFALLSSPDLKTWKEESRFDLPKGIDCSDMFELPVDGDVNNRRWVFQAGDGTYAIGTFDGKTFTREGEVRLPTVNWDQNGANGYAAQTFNDMPASDGRRIQIAWLRTGSYPNMPFNQQDTVPCELTLHTTPDGIQLHRKPVREIDELHGARWSWDQKSLRFDENVLSGISGELFDIRAEIDPGTAAEVAFRIRGAEVRYNASMATLSCLGKTIPAGSTDGRLRLRMLVDRTTLEVFADKGRTSLSFFLEPNDEGTPLGLSVSGGEATIYSLTVWEMLPASPHEPSGNGEVGRRCGCGVGSMFVDLESRRFGLSDCGVQRCFGEGLL